VLLLHEPFTARMAVAAALVFSGVAVVRWTRTSPATASNATAPRDSAQARRQTA
jgi:drug/metabolite transporter (DMT)-like permease